MATVTKNFRIKSGLIVEGTTGTINGQNILTETGGDQYILNLVGGATLVKSVDTNVFNVDNAGNLTVNANTFDSYGSAADAQAAAASDATSKANAAQAAAEATAASDATTKANAAESNAISTASTDATNKANAALSSAQSYADSAASTAYSNAVSDSASDATTKANNAQSNAEDYADGLISTEVTNRNNAISDAIDTEVSDRNSAISTAITNLNLSGTYDALGAANQALSDANDYTDTAVANLVDGAPALLNTLNELAAAIADNPNYATDVANLVSTKADTTYVDGEISDLNTAAQGYASAAQSAAESFATSAANTAQNNAEDYADSLASNYDAAGAAASAQSAAQTYADNAASAAQSAAEATAAAALSNVLDATTPFTDLNINDVAKQIAARTTSLGSVAVTAYQFNKSAFKSGKFLVKIDNGTHNEISEILITLDSSNNIAITEYAIVGTNGSRGTITADIDNSHCRIRVTPVNDSTITISGTIFNS